MVSPVTIVVGSAVGSGSAVAYAISVARCKMADAVSVSDSAVCRAMFVGASSVSRTCAVPRRAARVGFNIGVNVLGICVCVSVALTGVVTGFGVTDRPAAGVTGSDVTSKLAWAAGRVEVASPLLHPARHTIKFTSQKRFRIFTYKHVRHLLPAVRAPVVPIAPSLPRQ